MQVDRLATDLHNKRYKCGGDQVKEGALNNCQELWSGKVMKFVASLLLDCAVK